MELAIIICMAVICAAFSVVAGYKTVQILQLEAYRSKGFIKYLKRTGYDLVSRYFAYAFFAFTSMLVYVMCLSGKKYIDLIGFAFYILISAVFVVATVKERKKTPLRFTGRVKRLFVLYAIVISAVCFVSVYFTFDTVFMYSFCGLLPLFIAPAVLLSNLILLPIEKSINNKYKRLAQNKLAQYHTVSVGITGSYGKTTAKNILNNMLSQRFEVLASPKSYNTPMGIASTVNADLKENQIFIAEMGARYVGDIAELVDMVKPDYGVITSIGSQHLESFGSLDNVIKTKFEMAAANKALFVNGDDPTIMSNLDKISDKEIIVSGAGSEVSYKDVEYSAEGVSFTLITPDGEFAVNSKLLGEYVPSLIALCGAVAHKMGVEGKLIAKAVNELEPVEHRLQLIKNERAIIIDDAYNGNPEGAEAALKALSKFKGTKIIITPGLVELGERQEEYNQRLGKSIAGVCDYALLIGANSKALAAGIKEGGGNCKAYRFDFLSQAMKLYATLEIQEPVVLFENDLPDNL